MNASLHDAYASGYDRQVLEYGSHVHEALFGLCFSRVRPRQRLLDLGIGTGLAAELFAAVGLQVYGIDFSRAMLDLCRSKGFAAGLVQQDVRQTPWPAVTQAFEEVISCGVFHFIPGLEEIFLEAKRVLKPDGLFAFTIKVPTVPVPTDEKYDRTFVGGMEIFSHTPGYIERLTLESGFDLLKAMRCFVGEDIFHIWAAVRK